MEDEKKTFLVGFSGGADSTAALLLLHEHMEQGNRLVAVHFNHHLRGAESDAEAENASRFAAERKIEFRLIDLDIAPGGNLEARARQARLDAWKKLVAEYENAVVVTGHHKDDCIENMFLRIGRGSNVSGLTGLQITSEVEGVKFFRPLIIYSRSEIEAFLLKRGVKQWAVDSSNLECDYTRNVLRNKILPELYELFPGGRKAFGKTLDNLCDDAAFIEQEAYSRYKNSEDRHTIAFWADQPRALQVRMLKHLSKEFFNDERPLTSGAVESFEAMVESRSSGICELDEKRKLYFADGKIHPFEPIAKFDLSWDFRRQPELVLPGKWTFRCEMVKALPETCGAWEAFFDMDALPETLTVTPASPGEKMVPFGRANPVSLKKLRVDAKVPAHLAPPVLKGENQIIWFPGVRRSNLAPVGGKSRIIRFFIEKNVFLPGKNL
ncbi:MAG: tRNA lysidine(34) synthetase TilS [Lentisphaeria bacterium]|nr:tRNA lysidine(34) synthetase TilS [Lentisphaeria bacterium]